MLADIVDYYICNRKWNIKNSILILRFLLFYLTVNDFDDIKKMKNLDVDGIFSNFPDRL
tara:strand:- start:1077 stop:1253 length:177 start_codon:yes stop_codon:yes gene_type:complete